MKTNILSFIASYFLRILRLTYNYQLEFPDENTKAQFNKFINTKKPNWGTNFLLAFFHQDELCLIPYFKHTGFSVLVSKSKDGEIMSRASSRLGYLPVRGSSSKGAVAGLIAAIKKVREGYNFAFAVDGPRGPIYKVKEGVCAVSKKTDRPILPVRCIASNEFIFKKSWNQAKLPLPFSTITLRFGPFSNYESQQLEKALLELN